MLLVSSCSYFYPIRWSQVLSWECWCSWRSTNRRCSNYIWVINNLIAYWSASYIRDLTVGAFPFVTVGMWWKVRGWVCNADYLLCSASQKVPVHWSHILQCPFKTFRLLSGALWGIRLMHSRISEKGLLLLMMLYLGHGLFPNQHIDAGLHIYGHDWFRYWLVAYSVPSHYLNQYWHFVTKRVSQMLAPLVAHRQPARYQNRLTKVLYDFEHKTYYILVSALHTCSVEFWHICNIAPRISKIQSC